jgi:hypothetical protein
MTKKTRSFTFSILLTLALLASTITVVFAAPPLLLHIEVQETIGSSGEPFIASGSAVDNSLVCATGTVDDLEVIVSGPINGNFRILNVLKRFTCDDLSGTFDVKMVVKLDLLTNATTAHWKIVDGSGSYVNLKGNGTLVGTPIVPGTSILDVYDGKVH